MKEISLKERLKQMRKSEDPYERGMAKGIEITMKAYGHDDIGGEDEDQRKGQSAD